MFCESSYVEMEHSYKFKNVCASYYFENARFRQNLHNSQPINNF